jgi:transketolase
MTTSETPFEIGRAYYLWKSESPQVSIIGCGSLLHEALKAAQSLEARGVRVSVINAHTIKPLDTATILKAASESGAVVTVEEHQVAGGLGSAVAELLAATRPVPIEFVGVKDRYGQSGTTAELYKEYGLDSEAIQRAVENVLKRA